MDGETLEQSSIGGPGQAGLEPPPLFYQQSGDNISSPDFFSESPSEKRSIEFLDAIDASQYNVRRDDDKAHRIRQPHDAFSIPLVSQHVTLKKLETFNVFSSSTVASNRNNIDDESMRGNLTNEEKDQECTESLMAISPDGKELAILYSDTKLLEHRRIYEDGTTAVVRHLGRVLKYKNADYEKHGWSLAISNTGPDGSVYIALSMLNLSKISGNNLQIRRIRPQPVRDDMQYPPIFDDIWNGSIACVRSLGGRDIYRWFPFGGGILKFVNGKDLVVFTRDHFQLINIENAHTNWVPTWLQNFDILVPILKRIKEFHKDFRYRIPHYYPPHMEELLQKRDGRFGCMALQNCVIGDFLFAVTSNGNIEMYSIISGYMIKLFLAPPGTDPAQIGVPVFTISPDGRLFAVTLGNSTVDIYKLSNSLHIVRHTITDFACTVKMLAFIDGNTKLAIFVQKDPESRSVTGEYKLIIWNLFGNILPDKSDHQVQNFDQIKVNGQLLPFVHSEGRIIQLNADGHINSIGHHFDPCMDERSAFWDRKSIPRAPTNHPTKPRRPFQPPNLQDGTTFEPWNPGENVEFFLFEQGQFIVGQNTIQLWRNHNPIDSGANSLEYIWTIPTKLAKQYGGVIISHSGIYREAPTEIKVYLGSTKTKSELEVQLNSFRIKVSLRPSITSLVDALKAISFLNKKMKKQKVNGVQWENIQSLINYTKELIPAFVDLAQTNPICFRFLDARYHILSRLIRWEFYDIVHGILGAVDPSTGVNLRLHIPRTTKPPKKANKISWSWKAARPATIKNSFSALAISLRKGNRTMVEQLVAYYLAFADEDIGWMTTISKTLPTMYKYYPKLVVRMFSHKIFHAKEIPLDESYELYLPREPIKGVRAFSVSFNLFDHRRHEHYQQRDATQRSTWRQPNVEYFAVPLPEFINSRPRRQKVTHAFLNFIYNLFFLDTRRGESSPFTQLSFLDKTGQIFENPTIEAVIDFKWSKYGGALTIVHFVLYIIYAVLYIWLVYRHLENVVFAEPVPIYYTSVAFMNAIVAYILFTGKIKRSAYIRAQELARVLYIFDTIGAVSPLVGLGIILSVRAQVKRDGREADLLSSGMTYCQNNTSSCEKQVIFLSFSLLLIWTAFFFQMRFLPVVGKYIFLIINIMTKVFGFLLSQLFVIIGFGITMFILLHYSPALGVLPNGNNFQGVFVATSANGTQLPIDVNTYPTLQLTQEINVNDISDNYFFNMVKSIESVYFWLAGRWDQLDQWNFWPVEVVSVLASVFLATLMQNLLIALMGDAITSAKISNRALIQMKAQLLTGYPDLFHWNKYIYYAIPTKLSRKFQPDEDLKPESKEVVNFGPNVSALADDDDFDDMSDIQEKLQEMQTHGEASERRMSRLEERIEGIEQNMRLILEAVQQRGAT